MIPGICPENIIIPIRRNTHASPKILQSLIHRLQANLVILDIFAVSPEHDIRSDAGEDLIMVIPPLMVIMNKYIVAFIKHFSLFITPLHHVSPYSLLHFTLLAYTPCMPADEHKPLQLERHKKIRSILLERGAVRVSEFSRLPDISENTIRRDLIRLEEQGFCPRTEGGAVLKEETGQSAEPVSEITSQHLSMAAAAASRVQSGETIILDSGLVSIPMAEELTKKSHITVITSSLKVAGILKGRPSITVILSGGIVHGPGDSCTGPPAEDFFSGIHADRLFLSLDGVSAETGLSERSMEEAAVKRKMISCADHKKLGRTALRKLATLEEVDFIITGKSVNPDTIRAFSDAGVAVIAADQDGYDLYPGSGEPDFTS